MDEYWDGQKLLSLINYEEVAKIIVDAAYPSKGTGGIGTKGSAKPCPACSLAEMKKTVEGLSELKSGSFGIYRAEAMPFMTDTEGLVFFLDIGDRSAVGLRKILTLLYESDSLALAEAVIVTDEWNEEKRRELEYIGCPLAWRIDYKIVLVKGGAVSTVAGTGILGCYETTAALWALPEREVDIKKISYKPIALAASRYLFGLNRSRLYCIQPSVKRRIANRIAINAGLHPRLISLEKSDETDRPGPMAIFLCDDLYSLGSVIKEMTEAAESTLKECTEGIIIVSTCWSWKHDLEMLYSRIAKLKNEYRFEFWLSHEAGKATRLSFGKMRYRRP